MEAHMSTPITAEALLEIVLGSTRTIYFPNDVVEVIDAHDFARELRAIIGNGSPVVFSSLVGMTVREACEFLMGRSTEERELHPAAFIRDQETGRTYQLGYGGMIDVTGEYISPENVTLTVSLEIGAGSKRIAAIIS